MQVSSINAPTCTDGNVRGVVEVTNDLNPDANVGLQDCTSTLENPTTDVEAFNNGFISLTILPNDFPDAEEPTTTTTVPPSADEPPRPPTRLRPLRQLPWHRPLPAEPLGRDAGDVDPALATGGW